MKERKGFRFWLAAVLAVVIATAAVLAVGCDSCGEEPGPKLEYVDKSDLPYVSDLDSYKKTDWTAKWIWTEETDADSYVAMRKKFTLSSVPTSAVASISAESKYYLWINGTLVVYDGSYKRGATRYDAFYEDIELAPYLKAGENTLAALVVYNGRSANSSVDPEAAGFLFEMKAGDESVASDTSFKVKRLKEYKNRKQLRGNYPNYPQASMLAEWNVYYDAREATGDFFKPDFDDSAWESAIVVGYPGAKPFNDLYKSVTPPFSFDKEYKDFVNAADYVGKKTTAAQTIKLKLPENMQFSPYFELEADNAELRITYYTDTYTTSGLNSFKDDYITKSGAQSYESYPWRSGNYLIIEAPAGITFKKLAYRRSAYPTETAGKFDSDDENMDLLWEKAVNTLKICMRDSYMDCPERERSPYIGDSTNQILETFYSLDENSYAMTKKTILLLSGWVTDKGDEPNSIPLRTPSAALNECPAQTLAFLTVVWDYYMYTGDTETVKAFYPIAKEYLKLWNMDSASGLIVQRAGTFMWTDWGEKIDDKVIQNCLYYMALKAVGNMADEFGFTSDKSFYTDRMSSIEKGFARFKTDVGYTSGTYNDDRANAIAVVAGLVPETDYPLVLNVLKTTENASPYMEKYVLEALCLMGEYDYAKTRMLKRYMPMIEDECSTLWELWDRDAGTVNHGWTGGPLTIMSMYFAGIRPTLKGYETYEICPQKVVSSLSAEVHTVRGNIALDITEKSGEYTFKVVIPADGATLRIPLAFGETVTVDNATAKGVENGYTVFELKAGSYIFNVK